MPRRRRVRAALLVCAAALAGALSSSSAAGAQEQVDDTAEVAAVEIPSEAESLRRWLTIWDVNDLVLLLDEFYRQLGPVLMCPDGDVSSQPCYLDFTHGGDGGGAVALADEPSADEHESEGVEVPAPSDTPEPDAGREGPSAAPQPRAPVTPSPRSTPTTTATASPEPRPSGPSGNGDETTPPSKRDESIEQRITELVNAARDREGLPPLEVEVSLVHGARTWSAHMAALVSLTHDLDLHLHLPLGARLVGENVAFRTTDHEVADKLHQQFMDSREHRRNVLDPDFDRIGVGVVQSDGLTWVTQRFVG
ncbi:MAG: hypothetical protein GEU81_05560 [Nitriliruptorales bacterium]|nr:hypothetical protein [Nitriliruptorales bacterium]